MYYTSLLLKLFVEGAAVFMQLTKQHLFPVAHLTVYLCNNAGSTVSLEIFSLTWSVQDQPRFQY